MHALDLVCLTALMRCTAGRPEIRIGLIDGAVAADHPELATAGIRSLGSRSGAPDPAATAHGTFVAGILVARRGSAAPAICPGCALLVRPIFLGRRDDATDALTATPDEVADAIVDSVAAGVQLLNLSVAPALPSPNRERRLEDALDHAAARGVIVVAAAGNQGVVGSSAITRHPAVIPVVACDAQARPLAGTNLGASIARKGLMAPGQDITSLAPGGRTLTMSGTSAAAPFVTGTAALLWSLFPEATATSIYLALARGRGRRLSVVPPLLDAWSAAGAIMARQSAPARRWRNGLAEAGPRPLGQTACPSETGP